MLCIASFVQVGTEQNKGPIPEHTFASCNLYSIGCCVAKKGETKPKTSFYPAPRLNLFFFACSKLTTIDRLGPVRQSISNNETLLQRLVPLQPLETRCDGAVHPQRDGHFEALAS